MFACKNYAHICVFFFPLFIFFKPFVIETLKVSLFLEFMHILAFQSRVFYAISQNFLLKLVDGNKATDAFLHSNVFRCWSLC